MTTQIEALLEQRKLQEQEAKEAKHRTFAKEILASVRQLRQKFDAEIAGHNATARAIRPESPIVIRENEQIRALFSRGVTDETIAEGIAETERRRDEHGSDPRTPQMGQRAGRVARVEPKMERELPRAVWLKEWQAGFKHE